jgi:hypothetical protein
MINDKKILVLPGTLQSVKNYDGYEGLEIWMKRGQEKRLQDENADYLIGHSLGASFALAYNRNPDCKFIFINPLVKKRSIPKLVLRWMKFRINEWVSMDKVIPLKYWPYTISEVIKLLRVDVLAEIRRITRENVFIIKGKNDDFFCDRETAELIRENGINMIEVEAGHDWNENIAEAVRNSILTAN